MTKKSPRDEAVERLERMAGLSPEAVGVGRKIDRKPISWWRNKNGEETANPLDGTRLWDNS